MRRQASSAVQAARPRQMASTPHQSVFSFTNASLSFAPRGAFAEPPAPEGRAACPCLHLLPVAPSQSLRRPRVGQLTGLLLFDELAHGPAEAAVGHHAGVLARSAAPQHVDVL